MKKYVIREVVNHYHLVEVDDEVDIENVMYAANKEPTGTAYEIIDDILKEYKDDHGFDYKIKPNYCGTDTVNIELEGYDYEF